MRLLWHSDFYDGPLSGMCLYEGEKHWFRLLDEDEKTGDRTFEIVEMTGQEIETHEKRQALFEQYVGSHTCYDENNKRNHESVRPHIDWDKFYKNDTLCPPLTGPVVKIVTEDELRAL